MDIFSWGDFVAGWVGGVAGLVVGHPADTIKVRQQAFGESCGIVKTFQTTVKYEGMRGLYKGLSFPLLSAGALNALFFGVYGNSLRLMEQWQDGTYGRRTCCDKIPSQNKPNNTMWHCNVFLAGCIGGVSACFLACPVDIIKIQMQAQTGLSSAKEWGAHNEPQHKGVIDCVKKLYGRQGTRGLYLGLYPMLLRDVASYGVYMLVYESGVRYSSWNPVLTTLMCGGTAGVVSWAMVTPIDVIKSRIQADCLQKPTYNGMWDCTVKSYRAHGFPVFFRGFTMVILRSFPVNAATFVTYEWALQMMTPEEHSAPKLVPH